MDETEKLHYLNAMGIRTWKVRNAAENSTNLVNNITLGNDESEEVELAKQQSKNLNRAQKIAQMSWDELSAEVSRCSECPLHQTRTKPVFGVGDQQADLLIIGEAPGANEDLQGEPFVGRAGQLLNAMFESIGLPREKVYIANILKSRPPNNRDPNPEEVAACMPFLLRQIALLKPKLIVTVGRIAAHNILQTTTAMGSLRGQEFAYGDKAIPLIVTYHPAYLLRSPREKRKAWQDMQFIATRLAELS